MEKRIKPYIGAMFAGFGAIALSILFFFFIFKFKYVSAVLKNIVVILRPFIYGMIIAYLVNPFCKWANARIIKYFPNIKPKLRNILSVSFALLLGVAIVYALIVLIVPQLIASIIQLTQTLPGQIQTAVDNIEKTLANKPMFLTYFKLIYGEVNDYVTTFLSDKVMPEMNVIISGVGSSVWDIILNIKDAIIGVIVAFYLLRSKELFCVQANLVIESIFGKKKSFFILNEVKYADLMFTNFLSGKIIDSLIIGVICYIFCLIVDMPDTLLVSVIIGITNIIPFFGPFIGAVPCSLLIYIEDPMSALVFVIFIIILQQVDGNIIGPKILGDSTGLSSFWVLFAILLFGGLFGFVGMIIGVPLFAVIYELVRNLVKVGLEKNDRLELLADYLEFKQENNIK